MSLPSKTSSTSLFHWGKNIHELVDGSLRIVCLMPLENSVHICPCSTSVILTSCSKTLWVQETPYLVLEFECTFPDVGMFNTVQITRINAVVVFNTVVELISLWKPPYQIVFDVWETLTLLFLVFKNIVIKQTGLLKCQNF